MRPTSPPSERVTFQHCTTVSPAPIGLAYEQQCSPVTSLAVSINKLLVGRLAIGGQEHRVGGAGFADAQQTPVRALRSVDAPMVVDGRRFVCEHHIATRAMPLQRGF